MRGVRSGSSVALVDPRTLLDPTVITTIYIFIWDQLEFTLHCKNAFLSAFQMQLHPCLEGIR